jgi:hypothetical protein
MTLEELTKDLQDLKESFRRHKHDGIETEKLGLTGTVAPGFTPKFIGLIYCDTSAAKVYISTGVSSSADWKLLN